ncbi:MAG: M14 family zinc carboxypeptidase [Gemmatimonadetes bacterium]|nr:M14 family zinc carboxypeptidase [Gemmatimonadota bacterium]
MLTLRRVSRLTMALIAVTIGTARAQSIPTPESVLGSRVGTDFFLATYDESLEYFRRLAQASDRVELREIGRTSEGNPWYIALISTAENLTNVERYREIAHRLAHPEGLTDAEARALTEEGKAIVHIDGGLHATEVAHAQHTMQLAYDLVTGDADPEIRAILENVILLLWPSINPDGQTIVADWYRSNLGTPYEVAPLPRLYQKYVGHDNNRDGYMLNMLESRVVTRVLREWEPQILYNHHQTAPFPARIWIPPFAEPISEFAHPLMWRTVNLLGMSMAQALEERGQKGAVHMGTGFDNWYPGFMDHANNFHNVAAFLTETGLYRYATPHFYTISDFPARSRDLRPQSLYSSPWPGGWWRLRDAVDYMLTASFSVLDVAAKYKHDLLYNRYQAGRDVIAAYRDGPPYAYFIPQDQRDPVAAVELLRRLAFNGIEIYQLSQSTQFEGMPLAANTWVIPMQQEFGNFVRQLFAVQNYPDLREYPEGPPDQPYDVAGWTLPFQMDVRVIEAAAPLTETLLSAMEPVRGDVLPWNSDVDDAAPFDSPRGVGFNSHPVAAGIVPPAGSTTGSGPALLVDPAQNNAFRAINQAWQQGGEVRFVPGVAGDSGVAGSSGRYAITNLDRSVLSDMVRDLALRAAWGRADGVPIAVPRVALYRPWQASMDEGWTRWLMERYDFAFTNVYNADIIAGALRQRYDVLVIADIGSSTILQGYAKGTLPPRYAGGIGREGVRALDTFVRAGGTLVTMNRSTLFAIDALYLPVENVVADIERDEFFMSGSIVSMQIDPSHPVMSGMPEDGKISVGGSPVFTVTDEYEGSVLAKYPKVGSPLLSGYLLGEEHLQGYAAALDVHHGEGHVILLAMRPQWRGQPFGNFRILFNAALYSAQLAAAAPDNAAFWTKPEPEEEEEETTEGR